MSVRTHRSETKCRLLGYGASLHNASVAVFLEPRIIRRMEIFCIIYGIPSVFLAIFFLKFLNRSEFKYSFYRLLQCDITLNMLCYANGWFLRFPNWSLTVPMMLVVYENFFVAFKFANFCVNYFFNIQAMSVIFMSVHRLSSSKFLSANEFWNKYYPHLYGATLFLSCFPSYFVMPLPKTYDYSSKSFVPTPMDPKAYALIYQVFFFEILIYFSTILIVNILTLIVIRQRFVNNATSKKSQKLMKNLTKIAVFNSVLFFIVFIWQFFGSKVLGDWLFWASLFVLSDALSLSIPYILLAFDQNVRTTLAKVVLDKAERMAGNLAKQRSSQRVTSVVSVI